MIEYNKLAIGDILKITGVGAPGFAEIGDYARVVEITPMSVRVENTSGVIATFMYQCGAERLEPTDFKDNFPS